jgi:class 3 adenylate cyclase
MATGIHTGEIDLAGDDIAGTSVHITGRVAALAEPGEILVSRTVKDLLAGSAISFTARARGSLRLTEAAGKWPLYAVTRRPERPSA